MLLLRQTDRHLGLSEQVAKVLGDPRRKASCTHDALSMVRQRVYGLALGYEDLNDHDGLRQDLALQTAVEKDQVLASASALCRFEQRTGRNEALRLHEVRVEPFMASYKRPPRRLILDFDATDDPVHGQQEGRFFHGYYDHYCFLPLYVFCGHQPRVSDLRPSRINAAKHAWAVLALLVKRLRQAWPKVRITLRGDSGCCRWRMLAWCERHGVDYLVGIARNARLSALAKPVLAQAREAFDHRGTKQRYVLTNLKGTPQYLYDKVYCARGEMENRIKEQQLDLFADRGL